METVITVAAVLLGVVGLILLADVVTVWRGDRNAIGSPERAEFVSGLAVLAFAAAFFIARGGGDEAPAAPGVDPAPSSAAADADRAVSRLTSAARVPDLRVEPEPEPKPEPDRPRRKPDEAPPEPPPEPPATTTTTPATTTPTTTPAPAPTTTPAPAPAPEPSPPASDLPFDSRE